MFNPLVGKEMGAISDGTSNTIAMGEFAKPTEQFSRHVKGGVVRYAFADIRSAGNARACLNATLDRSTLRTDGDFELMANVRFARAHRLIFGPLFIQGFQTILSPNSPCCTSGQSDTSWSIIATNNFHTGGVNAVFFDGAVRFVSETVDFGGTASRQREAGPSDFGVWEAMGTPAGGESASL
jgi:prepilin-type processing-associated H-X9-DG protein